MDKKGYIEVSKGNNKLSPDNFDIREIRFLLDSVEDMLYPLSRKNRPDITYSIHEGSVKNIFKTSIQAVVAFSAVMSLVSTTGSIDGLELPTALAIEKLQETSRKYN